MLFNCAASVVPSLPSGASHVPVNVPPTPVANGIIVGGGEGGLLSLNGVPTKPHTTPAFVVGVTVGEAWICASVRSSFLSGVCGPLTSMLKIVAVNDMAVCESFRVKTAVPNDAGLGAPVEVVGTAGGFSCAFVRV